MEKIYIVDYGIEKSGNQIRPSKEKIINESGWKDTGFDSTLWKEVEEECNIENAKEELKECIEGLICAECKISLLIMSVNKADIIGEKNNKIIFSF